MFRCIAYFFVIVFMCGTAKAENFTYGFQTVFDSDADLYLIGQENVRKFAEGFSPNALYWGPSIDGVPGILTYKFDFAKPSNSIHISAGLSCWDFVRFGAGYGGRGWGTASFLASTDGVNYQLLADVPRPNVLSGGLHYNQFVPDTFLGTNSLWFRVIMQSNGAPLSSYAVSQFSRTGPQPSGDNVFEIVVETIPEPSTLLMSTSFVLGLLCLRRP